MKSLLLLYLIIVIASCNTRQEISLKDDPNLATYFNQAEIADLIRILDFVDRELCNAPWSSSKSEVECLEDLMTWLIDTTRTLPIKTLGIDLSKQEEFIASLSPELRDEIWGSYDRVYRRSLPNSIGPSFPDTLNILGLNAFNRLFDYFKTIDNDNLQLTLNRIEQIGDYSTPLVFWHMVVHHEHVNLYDERIRLFYAIQIIRLNDHYTKESESLQQLLDEVAKRFEERQSE